jgi:hypothetical protein
MIINGAWTVTSLPYHYILDIPQLGLKMAYITPFREITEADLIPYEGHHPRKMNGVPVPSFLYRFYGLTKSGEIASEMIRARVTPSDKAEVERKAKEAGLSVTDFVRQKVLE